MDSHGSQTEMPRAVMPRDASESEGVIWGVAIGLAVLFAIVQIGFISTAALAATAFHSEAGGTPWFVEFTSGIGAIGLVLLLVFIDALVLAASAWLARRYWIGFIYLPPLLYLGIGIVATSLLLSRAVYWVLLRT